MTKRMQRSTTVHRLGSAFCKSEWRRFIDSISNCLNIKCGMHILYFILYFCSFRMTTLADSNVVCAIFQEFNLIIRNAYLNAKSRVFPLWKAVVALWWTWKRDKMRVKNGVTSSDGMQHFNVNCMHSTASINRLAVAQSSNQSSIDINKIIKCLRCKCSELKRVE